MSKVTAKYQVSVPRELARRYGIRPGDELEWLAAGDALRVVPARGQRGRLAVAERLALFDDGSRRHAERQRRRQAASSDEGRDWTRDALYEDRGRTR